MSLNGVMTDDARKLYCSSWASCVT